MKSTDVLADVHELLAQWCLERLREGDATAADLNIIRQFLKDNQISAQPVEETSFGELAKALPEIENVVSLQKRRA
tara:strand:+ start:380 stop:607 length:228 start_codon:yes stop_codon:yes gene_type:complete